MQHDFNFAISNQCISNQYKLFFWWALKYNSVHMHYQNFSNPPQWVFTPWWISPPKWVHIRGKSDPKQVFIEKVPFTSFCKKTLHTLIKLCIENTHIYISWRKYWEKMVGGLPFSCERQISKVILLFSTLLRFWHFSNHPWWI